MSTVYTHSFWKCGVWRRRLVALKTLCEHQEIVILASKRWMVEINVRMNNVIVTVKGMWTEQLEVPERGGGWRKILYGNLSRRRTSCNNLDNIRRIASSGMLRRVALVRTDVSEELTASVPPKRRFSQEPHGITSQKTQFFIVTVVKTSNLTLTTYTFP
jgi:hypothetical protein